MHNPSPDLLREMFDYNLETGVLSWKERPRSHFSRRSTWLRFNRTMAGKAAGSVNSNSYLTVGFYFEGALKIFQSHRIVWAIHHGEWPEGQIDHIDGNRQNNQINNLRVVSNRDNSRNAKRRVTNRSGATGVNWNKKGGKWHARINTREGRIHLGSFARKRDAIAARRAAEKEHGYHPNHGRTS